MNKTQGIIIMMNYYTISIIIFVIYTFILYKLMLIIKDKDTKIKDLSNKSMLEDLSLATSDQLFEEIKKRKNISYILLIASSNDVQRKLKIDIHEMDINQALAVLSTSSNIIYNKNNTSNTTLDEEEEDDNYR